MIIEPVVFRGESGELEGQVHLPDLAGPVELAALVCHPHPLYGGTMDNKVVYTVAKTLAARGIPAVRFNFRGVGKSMGVYDGGEGEAEDALSVLRECRARWPSAKWLVTGFSFGAYVAARVANESDLAALITIAPAVQHVDFNRLAKISCPWFLLQGEADEVVPPQAVYDFARTRQPSPILYRFPDTGHFFHGRLLLLSDTINEIVDSIIRGEGIVPLLADS